MTHTFGETLYKTLKPYFSLNHVFHRNDPIKNIETIENLLMEINITKCSIKDIEFMYPGAILHLEYLLQSKENINFGICNFFKVWKNKAGWQYGCKFDKGKNERIHVFCYGKIGNCERKKEYSYYRRQIK